MDGQITQTIGCPLPGFETVKVTFNLMATPEQVNNFVRQAGDNGSHVGVVTVDGWPAEEWGPNPWDIRRVPGVWAAWAARKGYGIAMKAYLDDPNS